ncbi:efflux RND transporter periplasmic adaptor subunit [Chryseobacterium timonianum]|uniref:efflux RND transporter periplasmic adaptor subunit n=1 Tax=Chryseobacterium timonianum TaxID=1805473 RepID=UPI001F4B62E4|nr:efflux RND transporter periplasmic adaptor subunit [Chryseobacterium timonianum]
MKQLLYMSLAAFLFFSCSNKKDKADHLTKNHSDKIDSLYTCPMPEDSVFSDKPGNCPKCGMELIKNEVHTNVYSCPMHPEVKSDKPGKCPKCGMDLVLKKVSDINKNDLDLNDLIKPTNEFVISSIPLTTARLENKDFTVHALGVIDYDTRMIGTISARISGRIERLYVRYRFQKVSKGQRVMDIYSPEIMEAQQNLLFLLKNDAGNMTMIQAAKQKLTLLGMSEDQLRQVIRKGKPDFTLSVYSNYSGHIHEAGSMTAGTAPAPSMGGSAQSSIELALKEGMYVQKSQTIFNVFNPSKSWVSLNIFPDDVTLLKVGQSVKIIPEAAPDKSFNGKIGFIEPFFRPGSKTLTVRIYFDNSRIQLPVGSQVKAEISAGNVSGNWITKEAVISLGLSKVVFKKVLGGFIVSKVETGSAKDNYVEILNGIKPTDSIAKNAQYLMDSESFVRIKNN